MKMRGKLRTCLLLLALPAAGPACNSVEQVPVEATTAADALSGAIRDDAGRPVGGAWVTAVADDGVTHVRRTVVSSPDGRYLLQGLAPKASHRVRVRAYGYEDVWLRGVVAGRAVDVSLERLGAAATAAQYPSSYWLSLLTPPPPLPPPPQSPSAEPAKAGTPTSAEWTTNVIYNCAHCHQIGTRVMRQPRTREQWSETFRLSARTEFAIARLDRNRVVDLFTAWSERVRAGELPAEAPARPSGAAARAVITEWDVGGPLTWFRELAAGNASKSSTGARPPRGATGKWVYTADVAWGTLVAVNIDTGERREWTIPVRGKQVWPYGSWDLFHMTSAPITLQVDRDGKIVIVALVSDESPPGVLTNGVVALTPMLPPLTDGRTYGGNHQLLVFDPQSETWDPILTPCDTHGLTIAHDGRYWQTRQEDKICSYDPAQKLSKAYAWPEEWGRGIVGGNDVSDDDKVWFFFTFTFSKQDTLAMYDAKKNDFKRWPIPQPARLPRHICVDSQNRPYMLLLSGHLGRFDPTTEQFSLWELPEAHLGKGGFAVNLGFSCVVDKEGATGVKDAVYISGNLSDSIIAFDPSKESFVNYRMPGHFYTKDLEIFDGAVWAVHAENPEKYLEPDPTTGVATPRLIRLEPSTKP